MTLLLDIHASDVSNPDPDGKFTFTVNKREDAFEVTETSLSVHPGFK